MTKEDIISMARKAGLSPDELACQFLERFAKLVAEEERKACLYCYSPDDTATDWADKIKARNK